MPIITLEQLRQFAGFENITEQEGQAIINTLYQFSVLAYRFFHQNQ